DVNEIVGSNGAKHSLSNAIRELGQEGDEVIIPAPYWLTYPELVKLSDGTPVIAELLPENGFKLTPEQLRSLITPKTKAIIINNPSNPTGVVYSKEEIMALAKELENHKHVYVLSDEIYEKLVYGVETMSIAACSEEMKKRTIIINGMSKAYAMTGWRIGYTASSLEIAKAMSSIQSHSTSNPNSIAQYASVVALSDKKGDEFLANMNEIFCKRRNLMVELMEKVGLPIIKPEGAFYVMVNVKSLFGKSYDGQEIKTAMDVATIMLDKLYTAVIPCESFGANDYVRLSYATGDKQIREGLARFEKFVKGCK
ncbi:MAG: pyridoxal phosphate-dependent aminotransferase, partial [Clostridiales bacterium]|nr:pyridoxal phosphate-dependent aminotransferase [Clostridiales bacterium]